ncbi:MAG TPA: DUF3291 domain-containing protein [Saprospiraceae bacterium]|nr:DUF3291 domain-containing protein [Saprospiraceae bacterium]HMQ81611.1 DUF3291 domain-containing protein [Saprospiraceae bacterium]
MSALATLSFFEYKGIANKWWAFKQMGLVPPQLSAVEGLTFGKMLGTGAGNGFSIWPNLNTYAFLGSWEKEENAQAFMQKHPIFEAFRSRCANTWTFYLEAANSRGQWSGQEPFQVFEPLEANESVAVLTRATLHPRYIWHFWRHVPRVSQAVEDKPGRILSMGVGDWPLVQQVTFSIWESCQQMEAYAYKSAHREVIEKVRQMGWFKEELFVRFHVLKMEGNPPMNAQALMAKMAH